MQRVAPKDGSVITLQSQTLPFDTLLGFSEGADAGQFRWLGRLAMNVEVGVTLARSGLRSADDLRTREVTVGGAGGTASSSLVPFLLKQLAGARFKLVSGYQSAQEALLAMQRGEVEVVGAMGISTMRAVHAAELYDGSMRLLYQTALQRHPLLPSVPTLGELGRTPEETQQLGLFASTADVGRSLAVAADAPADRIAALERAVAAMLADKAMLSEANDSRLVLEPASADEIQAIVRATLATPKALAAKARAVVDEMKAGR